MSSPKIRCETPTPGKQGTSIDKWKYDAVRQAILRAVPRSGTGVAFKDLPGMVEDLLPAETRQRLGSIPWYVTTVKLDMEVKGELKRSGRAPQRLLRSQGRA